MTPEKLDRLKVLQDLLASKQLLSENESRELHGLRVELGHEPEVADDPTTWLVDESRRPDVVHGGDYNAVLHQMRCEEAKDVLAALLKRVGALAFDVGMAALKR